MLSSFRAVASDGCETADGWDMALSWGETLAVERAWGTMRAPLYLLICTWAEG